MDISSIVATEVALANAKQSGRVNSASAVDRAFKDSSTRVEQKLATTQVKLSTLGQIKGALGEVQGAGIFAADAKNTATANDAKKAAKGLVDAYNKANRALAAATDAKRAGALTDDGRTLATAADLRRSLNDGDTLGDLKKIGIVQNKDGSLSLDNRAFDRALQTNREQTRTALTRAATRIERTASRELADNGNLAASADTATARLRALETQQTQQQDQVTDTQRVIEQQAKQVDNVIAGGLAAYQRMFAS